jgi:Uma2 family endonuclease
MGWLIDPDEELIFVYLADRTIAVFEEKDELLPIPGFAASFQLTGGQLFSWLED